MPIARARMIRGAVCGAVLLAAGATERVDAQEYFGQNQVEYRRLSWRVIETEHFSLHYYPAERRAAYDAARMAERDYARLSRVLDHEFHEKKPILLFASRSDFGQNNVTGDLGEGVGGVTEAERDRILLPFTGDLRSFERVLAHEMTHAFQYDVFGRGRAGAGLRTLALVNPPYWFMEGMAEYLALGPNHPLTSAVMRDAVLNGHMPTIDEMTRDPRRYFPYRYGEALWAYIGGRWGDEAIGEIMAEVPAGGVERAFRLVLGLSLADLSQEWREAMEARYLPGVASLVRPRVFAQPLLTPRRTGSSIFVAPSLSSDGRYIAFISTGSFLRGEVFPDLWLADARTGKRIKRLVRSTTNPNFTELNLLYSQNDFSPDGRYLAFTALTSGRNVLYLLDMRHGTVVKRYHLSVDVSSPAFSPDGTQIVFTGMQGGITDLYVIDVRGRHLRRLTDDQYGDRQPQWSPDGRTIAFTSDRGPDADLALLRLPRWRICLYDVESSQVTVPPGQDGLNLNPMWAPDGQSIAYISDRSGTANIYLYDLVSRSHYQLTKVTGAVSAFTEYSPAITWARGADRLAFTYYEGDQYHVWAVNAPRRLRGIMPLDTTVTPPRLLAQRAVDSATGADRAPPAQPGPMSSADSVVAASARSFYRDSTGAIRRSDTLPGVVGPSQPSAVTVVGLLDSASLALPDSTRFKDRPYRGGFHADYLAQPSVGYGANNYYSGVYGGTTVILSDLVGDQHLALSTEINGRFSDAEIFAAYTNLSRRVQYTIGGYQAPYYYYSSDLYTPTSGTTGNESLHLTRDGIRQLFALSQYPLNRFLRWEVGARYTNLARSTYFISRTFDLASGAATAYNLDSVRAASNDSYAQPFLALVSDNALFGATGPISGERLRLQVQPAVGTRSWVEYSADYRRYFPILFDYLTLATRLLGDVKMGPDELFVPDYIASPYLLRGYDRSDGYYPGCDLTNSASASCSLVQTLGSRILVGNAEIRFPIVRRIDLGVLPVTLPEIDGLFFGDMGVAWSRGQTVYWSRPANYNLSRQRYPLTSYGAGVRVNLYNIAIMRWDFAVPVDAGSRGYWRWSVGPDF
jgi:Tol biopolymer transport system component